MKRFIDEIIINNPELVEPIVKGIEATPNLEVELYEKDTFDMNRNCKVPGGITTMLKVFKNEYL